MIKTVILTPPNPEWTKKFDLIQRDIAAAMPLEYFQIYHIGSTSIPSIYAKPIIDVLIDVDSFDVMAVVEKKLQKLGYQSKGENGIAGRRYFSTSAHNSIQAHLHFFESGSIHIKYHLAFRDYLRTFPHIAQSYNDLKKSLARQFPQDRDRYQKEKSPFIEQTTREALKWKAATVLD